jgi:large subunit ribosomal protein LP0
MGVKRVYDEGHIFGPEVLDITTADILNKFRAAVANMASISLASGYITKPAIPHIINNAFKNLAAIAFTSDVTFKQAEKLKEAAKNAVAVAASAPAGGSAAPKKEEKKVEEKPKEEEADVDMGGLFGDEY